MKYSLDDKLKYNQNRTDDFAMGYRLGVRLYDDYPKCGQQGQQQTKKLIDGFKVTARNGDKYSKGIMCGVRDAADERKSRKKGKTSL